MAEEDVLYQTNATELRRADRKMRILRALLIFLFDFGILYAMIFVQFTILHVPNPLVSITAFLVLTILVLPVPILIVPSNYRILPRGIDSKEKKIIPIKHTYRTKANQKRMYVSLLHPRRGEFVRLYSSDTIKLRNVLQRIIQR
ncbi:DUF2208 family protein [Candidatus Bathyarchaeota archaeon]|nr:DUF2208 family protein [Candidatus Bathyarchaeota archaeon]